MKDEEGSIFIDRNGRYFEPILNYLRTGELFIPQSMPREAIMQEADFYCIVPLVQEIHLLESDACGGKFFDTMIPGTSFLKTCSEQKTHSRTRQWVQSTAINYLREPSGCT